MSLSVTYFDVPDGIQEAIAVDSSSAQNAATNNQLVTSGFKDKAWATLEPKGWPLDGTRAILPDSALDVGWWSKTRSGADGRFAVPPSITLSTGSEETYTAPGLTFRFWPSMNSWCSEMKISWYRDAGDGNGGVTETLLKSITVYPKGPQWVVLQEVEAFNRIEIELLATNIPGQFAKLQFIQIGQVVVFLRDELVRVSLLQEADPSSCELSVDTLSVEIREKKGLVLKPQKNQKIELYRNNALVATQYITDSSRNSMQEYSFKSQSAIGRLEDTFLGGIYKDKPVKVLLGDVLQNFLFELDSRLPSTVTGYLPVCTRREALQQIAFAIGATVLSDSDGTILLKSVDTSAPVKLGKSDIFTGASQTREARTASVQITAHAYVKTNEADTLLDNVEVLGKDVLFTFSEPHYGYAFSGAMPGVTLTAYGSNWVKITAEEQTAVTLTAKKYNHTTAVHTYTNPKASYAEKGNVVSVDGATLIHRGNVASALNRLVAFQELKDVLTEDVVVGSQAVGKKAESVNPWGSLTAGYITSMESEFTDTGRTAKITIRGTEQEASEAEVLTV